MKLIKLFVFLIFLSSCNGYVGRVEPDYVPKNESSDFLSSDIDLNEQKIETNSNSIKYPQHKVFFNDFNIEKLNKFISLDKNSFVYYNDENIFYTKKDILFKFNVSNSKIENKYNLDLEKDENIVMIFKYENMLYLLSNKSKLFNLDKGSVNLISDFQTFSNSNPILLDNSVLIFSVFGEILVIQLDSKKINSKGNFITNHGVSLNSNSYIYQNFRSYLYNSGTLIFLDAINNEIQSSYFLEDLNILSSLNLFDEFIDAPFEFKQHLYFIDKKGLISVFNPISSSILWEVDVNSTINDYLFRDNGHLFVLTNNKVLIFNEEGALIYELIIDIEDPNLLLMNLDKLYIFNNRGINVFDLNSKAKENFIKLKFDGKATLINTPSNIFIKDNKALYKISE